MVKNLKVSYNSVPERRSAVPFQIDDANYWLGVDMTNDCAALLEEQLKFTSNTKFIKIFHSLKFNVFILIILEVFTGKIIEIE